VADKGVVPIKGKINVSGNGYPVCWHSGKVRYVHEVVCEAFHGPRPEGMEVLHLDDDKTNYDPSNLRWGTSSENRKMARGRGKNTRHKLTMADVAQIRAFRRIKPYGYAPIMAEKFDLTVQHIRDVAVAKKGIWT
jgi:hypothetical protein